MKKWIVERPHDKVIVTIMLNKSDKTYSFVNLTKEHICSCKFESIDEALKDMDNQIKQGKVIRYYLLSDVSEEK